MEPADHTPADQFDPPRASVQTLLPDAAVPGQHRGQWPGELDDADESHLIRGYD